MPNTNGSRASLTAVQAAPAKVAELLRAYGREAVDIAGLQRPEAGKTENGQAAAQPNIREELAALKVRTVEALGRLDDATSAALAHAREQLESEILPVMSTDPQVQRLFELRRATALARLTGLLERART